MGPLTVGYARCGRDPSDESAEREALAAAGVGADRIYIDVGLAGANRPDQVWAKQWRPAGQETRWW